jgi:hypothetical protein
MIEVTRNLFVGNNNDYNLIQSESDWAIVHACKEPYHRNALGYSGQGAPKEHPEYLVALTITMHLFHCSAKSTASPNTSR